MGFQLEFGHTGQWKEMATLLLVPGGSVPYKIPLYSLHWNYTCPSVRK